MKLKLTIDPQVAKAVLTPDEAVSLLQIFNDKRKKRAHTYENFFGIRMGCDMDLTAIKKAFKDASNGKLLLSNTVEGHNVAVFREGKGWLFIETNGKLIRELKEKRRITW
jgi:hypothetical protein